MIPAPYSKMGTPCCQLQYSTFSMGKEAKQIDPLLFLKIIIPFAFPLVGFLLPPLFHISTPSETGSDNCWIQEEGDEEHINEEQLQTDYIVAASQTEFIAQNVVRREHVEEETSIQEEIEILNNRVSEVEERESQIQLEFSEYCKMKNYESLVEKLQIMCLGLKTEYLEKQNQRLEDAIAKLMDERAEFETIRSEIKRLKRNFTKISKRHERNSLMAHQRLQECETKETELLKRNQEMEIAIREAMIQVKELEELAIEKGYPSLTQNKDTLNQNDTIRAEWAANMEEMIYLGCITTCLRHEISRSNQIEERKLELELKQNALPIKPESPVTMSTETTRNEIMKSQVRSEEVQECNEEIQPKPPIECTNDITSPVENCMDVMVRKNGFHMGNPKLIKKLKGWAKKKGQHS